MKNIEISYFSRAVPSTMVRPIILGAAASSNLLDGMKNQIRCGLHPQLPCILEMSLVNR